MSTHEISSWDPEYDDDEYIDNETASLEAQALQNVGESEDEGEDSDDSGTSSDGIAPVPMVIAPVLMINLLKVLNILIKEKEIRGDENPSRSLLWRKAHQNKNGEYDDDDVREKAAQLEEFDKQLEDGTLTKKPGIYSITLVFGEEHGGRVRCAGKGVTPTTYWHMPRKGASKEHIEKEHIELKKQLYDERRDEEMKEAMNAQAKMMSSLMSEIKSQGVLKKKKNNSKKARKSPVREKSLMPEAPVISNSQTKRQESNTNSKYPKSQHVSQSTASKDSSELQMHLPLNSPDESQLKDQTELSTIGKCKLAHATLQNIIAWGSVLPSVPGQLVHGNPLEDDCVRVTVEKSILKNHCLPNPSTHLKTVEDAKGSVVAWPKEFVICCSTNQPLSEPDEHDADPKTKKKKKKKPSDTKSGELKSRRSSKRLKTAA
ncbi:hypothetical protein MKW98_000223 [Papaver atlanticum]|uniref:DUF8039 domain-containing protein n=1 Tax=Papaver atlanticum TaxID=357466 RepID=A0AAD4SRU8_9MAGN|nr:hypothetical protein MKW98_000223 [Papaver atlanticum]